MFESAIFDRYPDGRTDDYSYGKKFEFGKESKFLALSRTLGRAKIKIMFFHGMSLTDEKLSLLRLIEDFKQLARCKIEFSYRVDCFLIELS